ncbi:unnamed protein product [Withania somnifera]
MTTNNLEGRVLRCLGNISSLEVLMVSHNNLSGEIPSSISNLTSQHILDLGRNNLKGAIPQRLGNMSGLQVLDMHSNKLSGTLPAVFSIGCSLRSLNLHGNELAGKIPPSLANCKELQVLDLGDNHLNGTFPMWLGTLPELRVLKLRSNKLHGLIRFSGAEIMFPDLRIIDLSYNAFSGNLPESLLRHLKGMETIEQTMKAPSDKYRYYEDSVTVATKGLEYEIVRILYLYTVIDLSSNRFEGHILSIVGDLIAIRVLNLSHNGLQGHIPPSLQRCIPQGPQFHTFESNSYKGNNGLRGFPVSKGCGNDRLSETNNTLSALDDQESSSEFLNDFWKAALMGYCSGLCIGLSIIYFMMSTENPIWLARIIQGLQYKIIMRRRKKQRGQRNYRRVL